MQGTPNPDFKKGVGLNADRLGEGGTQAINIASIACLKILCNGLFLQFCCNLLAKHTDLPIILSGLFKSQMPE
jgi:hypothetical protein